MTKDDSSFSEENFVVTAETADGPNIQAIPMDLSTDSSATWPQWSWQNIAWCDEGKLSLRIPNEDVNICLCFLQKNVVYTCLFCEVVYQSWNCFIVDVKVSIGFPKVYFVIRNVKCVELTEGY